MRGWDSAVGIIEELGEGVIGFEVTERVGFMPASNTCRESFPFILHSSEK